MGRAGFVRGSVYAQNLQAGSAVKTIAGTGWETTSVVFAEPMDSVPKIAIAQVAGNSDTTSVPSVTKVVVGSKTRVGFNLNINSSTTGVVYFDYVAMDDTAN